MRSLVVTVFAMALFTSACGDGGSEVVADVDADETPPTSAVTVPATSAPPSPPPSTTLPDSLTFEPSGDRSAAAAGFLSRQWSRLELWGDGWVEVAAVATGPPIVDRESEIGRLFSDEVHDAIEAAGATDMVAAYAAVTSAGLVTEVLDVLSAHPEVWDAIYGVGTLTMTAAETVDGSDWTTRPIPFLGLGSPMASASDGNRIGIVLGDDDNPDIRLAITTDLDRWSVADLAVPFAARNGYYDVVAIPGGGWLLTARDPEGADRLHAWIVSDAAEVVETALPGDVSCCSFEATSAGVFAHGGTFGTPSSAWFSTDGVDWEPRTVPNGQRISGVASVVDGLVISVRDDDAGTTTQWRGTPDGREWIRTELPTEIEWEVSVFDNNHEGIAQFVTVPGWGQRGYQPPVPAASFTVDHAGFRFDTTIGATSDLTFAVTVTDLAGGEVVFDESGPIAGLLPVWARTSGTDLELLDADGSVVVSIPLQPFEEAYAVALADAEAAEASARGPVAQAFLDATYLLHSLDGITWSSMIVDRAGGSFAPWLAASINGNRALYGNDDGYRVFELVDR